MLLSVIKANKRQKQIFVVYYINVNENRMPFKNGQSKDTDNIGTQNRGRRQSKDTDNIGTQNRGRRQSKDTDNIGTQNRGRRQSKDTDNIGKKKQRTKTAKRKTKDKQNRKLKRLAKWPPP